MITALKLTILPFLMAQWCHMATAQTSQPTVSLSRTTAVRGTPVSIILTSSEIKKVSSIGLSLSYDPQKLQFQSVRLLDPYDKTSTLLINTDGERRGLIGLSFGGLFSDIDLGVSADLIEFTFDVAIDSPEGVTPVILNDSVVPSLVLDENLAVVQSDFIDGSVNIIKSPVAVNDSFRLLEDGVIEVNIVANDIYGSLDFTEVEIVSLPTRGILIQADSGIYNYAPNADYNGRDSFLYRLKSVGSESNTATVEFTIVSINDPVTFSGPSDYVIDEDTTLDFIIGAVDNADGLTSGNNYIVEKYPSNGTLSVNPATGRSTYTPGVHYNGDDEFTIRVLDDDGFSQLRAYSVIISPVNDPTVFGGDIQITTPEDIPYSGLITAADPDGLTGESIFQVTSGPSLGNLDLNSLNGSYTYTPNQNLNGNDRFILSVTDDAGGVSDIEVRIEISAVNDPLVLLSESDYSLDEDTVLIERIVAADFADGIDEQDYASVRKEPLFGSLVMQRDGNFTYTPNSNYSGRDSFDIFITDLSGFLETITINLTIRPVDDPVVVLGPLVLQVTEDVSRQSNLNAVDDADGLTSKNVYSILKNGDLGQVTIDQQTGRYVYRPLPDMHGDDVFSIIVTDDFGFTAVFDVNVTINPTNDSAVWNYDPLAALQLEEDRSLIIIPFPLSDPDGIPTPVNVESNILPENGQIQESVVDGIKNYIYTPKQDYAGSDRIGFRFFDNEGFEEKITLQLQINPVDDPMTVVGDLSFTTQEDRGYFGRISATDDADGLNDGSYFTLHTPSVSGSVTIDIRSGIYDYIPNRNFNGEDSFVIAIQDDQGFIFLQNITGVVTPVADPPNAVRDNYDLVEGTIYTAGMLTSLLSNDTSPDDLAIKARPSTLTTSLGALVTILENGSFSYDPTNVPELNQMSLGDVFVDTFEYTVVDSNNATSNAQASLRITGVDYESDIAGIKVNGVDFPDNKVSLIDYLIIGEYITGLRKIGDNKELFQRVDSSPLSTSGDGIINLADWAQAARFVIGSNSRRLLGGPTEPNDNQTSGTQTEVLSEKEGIYAADKTLKSAPLRTAVSSTQELVNIICDYDPETSVCHVQLMLNIPENLTAMSFTLNFPSARTRPVEINELFQTERYPFSVFLNDLNTNRGDLGVLVSASIPGRAIPAGVYNILSLTTFPSPFDIINGNFFVDSSLVEKSAYTSEYAPLNFSYSIQTQNFQQPANFSEWIAYYINQDSYLNEFSLPDDDPDGDGFDNIIEYQLGFDPTVKDSISPTLFEHNGVVKLGIQLGSISAIAGDKIKVIEFDPGNTISQKVLDTPLIQSEQGVFIDLPMDSEYGFFRIILE